MGTLTFSPSLYIGMAYFFLVNISNFGILGVFRKNGYLGGREI